MEPVNDDVAPAVIHLARPPQTRTLRITVADSLEKFEIAIHDGVEPAALHYSVQARASLPQAGFFLTASSDRAGAIVPLSSALPDGISLVLHRATPSNDASYHQHPPSPPSQSQPQPQPVAAAATSASATSGTMLLTPLLISDSATSAPAAAPPPAAADSRLAGGAHRRIPSFGGSIAAAQTNQLEGLERLSRLTTDLANERTLLAYARARA